jgi:aldehyde dehydrogenase (NAD+)
LLLGVKIKMINFNNIYINGKWVTPSSKEKYDVVNPATSEIYAKVCASNNEDVNNAILAAKLAFTAWSNTSAQYRCDLINAAADEMQERADEIALSITNTMGCPLNISREVQVQGAIDAFRTYASKAFKMEDFESKDDVSICKEAIGVCTLINPWNYPLSQLVGKLAPALAAGCTMVIKPAEQTPVQDYILAEIFTKVGLPPGVFNLVPGLGSEIGSLLCSHPDVDMISFTGSNNVGKVISKIASSSIKRVCLELGGKSAFIITEDADFESAIRYGVEDVMINSGQTCTALTRMLVPLSRYEEAVSLAKVIAEENVVGDPLSDKTTMGPMSSKGQKNQVCSYIQKGIDEGARLVTGMDPSQTLNNGNYIMPTIFADVTNDMSIAREEIFGPVLSIISYVDIDHAVEIANDSDFGLSSAVYAASKEEAMKIGKRIRAGQCYVQGAYFNSEAPFGGFKQSGNGREWGDEGLLEFVEIKSFIG